MSQPLPDLIHQKKAFAANSFRIGIGTTILLFLGILCVFILHTIHLKVVVEDAFITFQFARHLANGQGIVWNVGEAPVEGYTNFLWLLLSALLIKSGVDVPFFAQLIGILASCVTLVYVYNYGRNLFDLPGTFALIPCLFLAISGPFAAWAGSGMETNLFGLFLIAGCYYFAGWVRFDSYKRLIASMVLLFMATLTRPEGFMIFVLMAALGTLFTGAGPRTDWMRYILAISIYVIPFLIYFFWRYSYFGYLLPNTFYAKTGGGLPQYLRGIKYSGLFLFHFIFPLLPLFFLVAWEQGFHGISIPVRWRAIIQQLKKNIDVYLPCLITVFYTLYIVYAGGDYMAMYRFFVPILPFFYLLLGPVSCMLFMKMAGTGYKRILVSGAIVFTLGMTALQSTPVESRLFRKPEFMHGTYQGIQFERWHVARYRVIAEFFREYKQEPQESIALGPIGVISYYSDLNVYSMFGIVDPYIAHKPMTGIGQVLAGHEKHDIPYVLTRRPTYFLFSLDLQPEPEAFPDYSGEVGRYLQENYQLQSVWLEDPVNQEAGYFTFLELKTHKP